MLVRVPTGLTFIHHPYIYIGTSRSLLISTRRSPLRPAPPPRPAGGPPPVRRSRASGGSSRCTWTRLAGCSKFPVYACLHIHIKAMIFYYIKVTILVLVYASKDDGFKERVQNLFVLITYIN